MGLERLSARARELGASFEEPFPLAPVLSLGIGGEALFRIRPPRWEAVPALLEALGDEGVPFRVLSGGSNILAADGALPFGILHLRGLGGTIRWSGPEAEADADVPLPRLAGESVRRGLAGLEGLGGVPGTVGGAAVMNAGAFGCEVGKVLSAVRLAEAEGGMAWHPASRFTFRYRSSDLRGRGVVCACRFLLAEDDREAVERRYAEAQERRKASQPWREPTLGSVFKNPPGDYAGRILEALGFKGRRRGRAGFSERHANFLVNYGGASFAEAFGLAEEARLAAEAAGFALEYEMEVWR
ncbi:MAG: UDP-N-acetylmuramate dehydrogenase [Acidobacteriota bacterium]